MKEVNQIKCIVTDEIGASRKRKEMSIFSEEEYEKNREEFIERVRREMEKNWAIVRIWLLKIKIDFEYLFSITVDSLHKKKKIYQNCEKMLQLFEKSQNSLQNNLF